MKLNELLGSLRAVGKAAGAIASAGKAVGRDFNKAADTQYSKMKNPFRGDQTSPEDSTTGLAIKHALKGYIVTKGSYIDAIKKAAKISKDENEIAAFQAILDRKEPTEQQATVLKRYLSKLN